MHQDFYVFDLGYCDDCGRTEDEVALTALRTERAMGACICAECALFVAREMGHPVLVEREREERYLRAVVDRWTGLTQDLTALPPPTTPAEALGALASLQQYFSEMQRAATLPMEAM